MGVGGELWGRGQTKTEQAQRSRKIGCLEEYIGSENEEEENP